MSSHIDEQQETDHRSAASSLIAFLSISEGYQMRRFLIPAVVIAAVIASSTVFAAPATHGKTRAEVRAELIQARQAGLLDAPDTTYPAAQLRAAAAMQSANAVATDAGTSAMGGAAAGHSESGRRTVSAPEARDSIYFGQ
jgi:hypothetical protein